MIAQAFILGGALLLLVGGFLVYPYASSRLVVPSPSPTGVLYAPAPTATSEPLARSPSLTPTRTPALTSTFSPTPRPIPTSPPVIPDRVIIPAIGLDAPIVPVSWTVAVVDGQEQPMWNLPGARAAGWHETSAPLGVPGNTVLNGHNTTNGEVFRSLYKLEPGDRVILCSGKTVYSYAVTQTLILPEAGQPLEVRIENARYIQPTQDERLTLVTCHPYGSLRNRLIVIARPIGHPVLSGDYLER